MTARSDTLCQQILSNKELKFDHWLYCWFVQVNTFFTRSASIIITVVKHILNIFCCKSWVKSNVNGVHDTEDMQYDQCVQCSLHKCSELVGHSEVTSDSHPALEASLPPACRFVLLCYTQPGDSSSSFRTNKSSLSIRGCQPAATFKLFPLIHIPTRIRNF